MRIVTKKFKSMSAFVLLSALVIGFTFLTSRLTREPGSFSWSAGKFAVEDEEREEAKREGEAAGVEWFMAERTYGLGYIPPDAEIRALEDMRHRMIPELAAQGYSLKKSTAGQLNWEYYGPGNIGGRLRGVLVHPTNPNVLYVGSVAGGVWKSTNAGASWLPTMNDLITLNISALVMKPGDPNTIYAGTGEGFFAGDALPGRGLLKTSDGGTSWRRIQFNSPFITALAVSPANPNVVYASGRKAIPLIKGRPAETVTDPGVSAIFKSTDSGETWQDITTGKGIEHDTQSEYDNFATDVAVSAVDANVVYATFGLRDVSGGIWKSVDGGQTWTRLTNGLPNPNLPNQGYNRIELAMAPSNSNVLYASFTYTKKPGDTNNLPNNAMLGIWKTTNAGQSWTQMAMPLTVNQLNRDNGDVTALGDQGDYASAIIVHPTDPNIVFVGGLDIYRTTDGGNSWTQVSMWVPPGFYNPERIPYVHADHHVFAFDGSANPPVLYNGSDGGIARSRDLGTTWEILNKDLGVTQFYFLAVHPDNSKIMLGGTQDNASLIFADDDINSWSAFPTGDGGPSHFDFNDPATAYYSGYYLNMYRARFDYATHQMLSKTYIGFGDGSNGLTQEDSDSSAFFPPFEISPNNSNELVLGTNRLLKSTDRGDHWTALTTRINSYILRIAITEGNDNAIWFSTGNARIYKTEDGGATYANVTATNLPKRFISDIEIDPSNRNTVYLTYSGYGTPHIFKTTNAGANWTNISSNLPDTPVNAIKVHPQNPNQLFLATDIGVFLSEDGGQIWQPCTNGFPTVQVMAIVLNTKLNRITVATHGRGVYSAQLSSSGAAILNVEPQEITINTKPGQTGSASFTIHNHGDVALSYNIVANAANGLSDKGFLSESVNSKLPKLPVFDLTTIPSTKGMTPVLRVEAAAAQTSPNSAALADVLMLDDGNNGADDFVGFGSGSANNFYWTNVFSLPQFGFRLESFDFYMRTEIAATNEIYIGVYDANGQKIIDGSLSLVTSVVGRWYSITLNNPLSFNAGSGFSILVGADKAISYPAGTDVDASVPNNSYYYDAASGRYVNLNTVAGFANGAFLIRSVGAKLGSANQPPIAKVRFSKSTASVNEVITFDASQSADPDGQITQYLWDFGDGSSSNLEIAAHAYSRAGNFVPKLTVTDNQGATGQAIGFLTISGGTNRLTVNPASGTIAPGGAQTLNVTYATQGLAEGNYQGQISITSNGGNKTIPVQVHVSNTTAVDENAATPRAFRLAQNYPNPFSATSAFGNAATSIRYELSHDGNVTLVVFDLNARRVALLESGLKTAGQHFVRWDGRDTAGNRVPNGVYFYRLEAISPNGTATVLTKKMTVIK